MKAKSMSPSQEDYLESVLFMEQQGKTVRVTDIAANLDVSKASVNKAVSLLKEAGMVEHEHYGTITLTEAGRRMAEEVALRHHTLKSFLHGVLGVEEATAEEDACMMEHVISQQTMTKLVEFMEKVKREGMV